MSKSEISYHQAIDMMEEFRQIMKRIHKKNNAPIRKPEFQAMLFLSCKEKIKRKKYIKLSERGIEYLESHKKAYEVWFKSMWDKFDAREKEAFNILLTKTNLVLREEIQDKEDNNETN